MVIKLPLPESYRAYCEDDGVRPAVDHILESKSLSLYAGIKWKHLPAFHRAVLSANQVRCEYAIFQIEFWDAVWKQARKESDLGEALKALPVAESEKVWDQKLDTNTVWEKWWFYRCYKFTTTGSSFYAGTMVARKYVMLAIGYYDADDVQRTTELELGDKWPEDDIDEYGFAYTRKKLAPIQDGGIDLAPLRKAADDALAAIKAHESDR